MSTPCIVINVYGGQVQDVFATDPQTAIYLADWDTDGCTPGSGSIVEVPKDGGGSDLAHVAKLSPEPMSRLAGTRVEGALRAAGIAPTPVGDEQRPPNNIQRDVADLNRADLEEIVSAIREFLYLDDDDPDQPSWTLEKDCSGADLVELASWLLDKHGLAPEEPPTC